MSDYKTRTIREVVHVEEWGWRVIATGPNQVLVHTLGDERVLDIEPDAARALAAALMAAADEAEGRR